jgi:tetratricopeptide (TPR) repeat protein
MKCSFSAPLRILCIGIGLTLFCVSALAQKAKPSKPINLDRALEEQSATDLVASYFHFSLSKWFENEGDALKALSEMQLALKYNPNSSAVQVEMATLLEKAGRIPEAIDHAEEAVRLDPKDPDPHWFLADIYFRAQELEKDPKEHLQKVIQELDKLQELIPADERVYYNLGAAYLRLKQPEKAIQAYEKFQSVSSNSDSGYREIAKYYEGIGNDEKAIEYLNKGLAVQPDSVESLDMLGRIYSKLNKNKEAVPVFRKLLEATGNNAIANRQLAASLLKAGEYKDVIAILKKLIETGPSEISDSLLLGQAQTGLRDYPEAIKTFQSILAENPGDLNAQFWLGSSYEESGKYADAIDWFSRILNKFPANSKERPRIQERLAENYLKLREFDKGIAIYQEMAKATPDANLGLLNAYRIGHRFDAALPLGKQLFEKEPNNTGLAIIYAQTLADAGKAKEGAEILSKQYEKNPNDIQVAVAYAKILAGTGKLKEGVNIFTRLLQSDPQNIALYVNLSRVYIEDKRFADAEKILRKAEDNSSNSEITEDLKLQRATIYYEKQKDFDRAESLFKEILKTNPNNATVLNFVGYMLAERGIRLDEAVQYVKGALAIDPRNGAYLDSLGWAFFKLNDLNNAQKYLLEADNFEKNDPTIKEHLGDFYFKSGDFQKALDYWTKSVRLGQDIGTQQEDIQKVRRKLESLQETLRKQKSGK